MGLAIIRIYLKKDLENLERLLYPVDLFKGKALGQEGDNAPLIQGNRVIECIDSILVPPQIKKGPAVFDPALFLVRIQPEASTYASAASPVRPSILRASPLCIQISPSPELISRALLNAEMASGILPRSESRIPFLDHASALAGLISRTRV